MEVKIKQGSEMLDATIEMVDGVMVVSPKEVKFEPKDGDVVACEDYGCLELFIFKERIDETECTCYCYYCEKYNSLCVDNDEYIVSRFATEEEKKILFDKLEEKGYEFDFEKKELIKLKWKPNCGTLYYRPGIRRAEINVVSDDWTDNDMDKSYYDKGWIFKTYEECDAFCNKLRQAIEGVKP